METGPDVGHGVTQSGFAASLALELKHNWGLDVISSLTKILSLWLTDQGFVPKIIWCSQKLIVLRA